MQSYDTTQVHMRTFHDFAGKNVCVHFFVAFVDKLCIFLRKHNAFEVVVSYWAIDRCCNFTLETKDFYKFSYRFSNRLRCRISGKFFRRTVENDNHLVKINGNHRISDTRKHHGKFVFFGRRNFSFLLQCSNELFEILGHFIETACQVFQIVSCMNIYASIQVPKTQLMKCQRKLLDWRHNASRHPCTDKHNKDKRDKNQHNKKGYSIAGYKRREKDKTYHPKRQN